MRRCNSTLSANRQFYMHGARSRTLYRTVHVLYSYCYWSTVQYVPAVQLRTCRMNSGG